MENEKGIIEIRESVDVEKDVAKRIRTTGVKGLDFEKAKELGFFTRISNLLCVTHAAIMAANRIYGGVDYMLSEFGGRRNDIAKAMSDYERSFDKFISFWTSYYAHGDAGKEVNDETETLYRRIMEWAQLPFEWNLGDRQRVEDNGLDVSIRVDINDKEYSFHTTMLDDETIGDVKEYWCVTKYDTREHSQKCVEDNMDKASAMMVAKRLSADDPANIYTASVVQERVKKETVITPYKAYKCNETVGRLMKVQK